MPSCYRVCAHFVVGQEPCGSLANYQCTWDADEAQKLTVSLFHFIILSSGRSSLRSSRYVWEGEQVRVTADITTSDLLRIEVKAHQVASMSDSIYSRTYTSVTLQCEPAIDFLRQLRSSAATMRAAGGAVSAPLITPPTSVASAKSI